MFTHLCCSICISSLPYFLTYTYYIRVSSLKYICKKIFEQRFELNIMLHNCHVTHTCARSRSHVLECSPECVLSHVWKILATFTAQVEADSVIHVG